MTGRPTYNRRSVLRAGLGAASAAGLGAAVGLGTGVRPVRAATSSLRGPGAMPYPSQPVGQYTGAFPFDHIVLVMQENHSFDNYLGMLPVSGQPRADGFTFNEAGEPVNWNPVGNERMYVYHQSGDIGAQDSGSQSWNDSHLQIAGGAMNGFAGTGPGSMGYYTEDDLPFYYSLANTFTLANRWFCSVPAQTYPNRRFLMAGTASGIVSTDIDNVTTYPPNGTIWDLLSANGISWKNYFSDAPTTAIILDTIFRYPANLTSIAEFFVDAAAGTLPSVSLVDCNMGAIQGEIPSIIGELPQPIPTFAATPDLAIETTCQSEENPEDVQLGEQFVASVVNAVMAGPGLAPHAAGLALRRAWRVLRPCGTPGGRPARRHAPRYRPDRPTRFVQPLRPPGAGGGGEPFSRPHDVTNVVHDHTSVLATIERQWNLPALTYRDANAATLADFLDPSVMAFAEPPDLAAPANPLPGLVQGYQGQPVPPTPASTVPTGS